jgi:hypothetical protein
MIFFIQQISFNRKSRLGVLIFGMLTNTIAAQERTVHINLVPDARSSEATPWRFTTEEPGANWSQPDFEDATWMQAKGGFGAGEIQGGSSIGQEWTTPDIWLRKSFNVADLNFENLILNLQHDDDVDVYLNGTLILAETFTGGFPAESYLSSEAKNALKLGVNMLALHCTNSGGGPQFIDAGLIGLKSTTATTSFQIGKPTRKAAPKSISKVLYLDKEMVLNLSGFPAMLDVTLELYGLDGTLRATLFPKGRKFINIPIHLGRGTYQYHWCSPTEFSQGLLVNLP